MTDPIIQLVWKILEGLLQTLHDQRIRKRELEELLSLSNRLGDDDVVLTIWKRQAENERAYNETRFNAETVIKTLKRLEGV